jgi:hypothetical protein
METEQLTFEWSVFHWRSKWANQKIIESNKNEDKLLDPLGHSKGGANRKVYNYECLH